MTRVAVRWMAVDGAAETTLEAWRGLLDERERQRAERFQFAVDRHSYIAAHALTRCMLARFGGHAPQDWRFVGGAFGKPAVDPSLDRPGLRFNLSHTRGFVACAVAEGSDLGIDVEAFDRPSAGLAIADRFFTSGETALIRDAAPEDRRRVFFRLWTLKECVMKATGRGFNLPLSAFSVALDPIGVRFEAEAGVEPTPWCFAQQAVTPRHMVAVGLRAETATFDVRGIVPDGAPLEEAVGA